MILPMMVNTEKLGVLEHYLKSLIEIITNQREPMMVLQEKKNCIEYKSKGDRYENLSAKEYLNMIRPYLGELINEHKPVDESNNESNESNDELSDENDDTDHAE